METIYILYWCVTHSCPQIVGKQSWKTNQYMYLWYWHFSMHLECSSKWTMFLSFLRQFCWVCNCLWLSFFSEWRHSLTGKNFPNFCAAFRPKCWCFICLSFQQEGGSLVCLPFWQKYWSVINVAIQVKCWSLYCVSSAECLSRVSSLLMLWKVVW